MAICKIISPNIILQAKTTIQESNIIGSRPASRLLTPHLWDYAESPGGAASYVTFDLNTARLVKSVALLGHTITQNCKIAGNSSNNWGAPPTGWITIPYAPGPMVAFFTGQTYQYWRIESYQTTVTRIGAVALGGYWTAPHAGYDGLRRRTRYSPDGTQQYRVVSFGLDNLTQEQSAALYKVIERHMQGQAAGPNHYGAVPTLVCLDSDGDIVAGGLQDWSIYGVFVGEAGPDMGYHTREKWQLTVEECL